ncbi:unnamed protein product [Arabis nemorensis]|uniref:Reverse transcriptase zinc-binding domain-containing protein n=1 Tax=Arabis nemorensis TaxID=586526 RepID=A0A565B866_9BRAS|nr:unnamed protein product [Arabis nemorensis]
MQNWKPSLKPIVKLIFHAVVYSIWKERNARLHSSVKKPQQVVTKEIQLLLRAKLTGLVASHVVQIHPILKGSSFLPFLDTLHQIVASHVVL